MTEFSYADMTTRNIGFVSPEDQERLRAATVFVCGTGGMGGACVLALARAGIGGLILADIDRFEVSNINRQVFANLDTVGKDKAEATAEACLRINPTMSVETLGKDWPDHLDAIAGRTRILVNGADDLAAGVRLYRTARARGATVIDAYAAPLPSVYVTRPGEPMPEERFGYPSLGKDARDITDDDRNAALMEELTYVLVHSSARRHVDLDVAGEVAAGRRSRMSFAPMVIATGMLMAGEAISLVLGRANGTDHRGWFLDVTKPAVERPRNRLVAAAMKPVVKRFLRRMTA
jgi:hypothetical protein